MNVTLPRRVRRLTSWLFPVLAIAACGAFSAHAPAQEDQRPANLLRNGRFQDDWMTLAPQAKTLHFNFSSEYQNRRDYNPDGWTLRGSWRWLDPDAAPGARRLVLGAPKAVISQRVNLAVVHDEEKTAMFPEGGDFATLSEVRSRDPLHVIRDMALRLRVRGTDVPADAAVATIRFQGLSGNSQTDPLGNEGATTHQAKVSLPAGTYGWQWVEVKIKSSDWLDAVAASIEKNAKLVANYKAKGVPLPATVGVTIQYEGDKGEVEIAEAQLLDAATSPRNFPNPPIERGTPGAPADADELAPNLLFNGNFEAGASEYDDPNAPNTGPRPAAIDEPMPMGWSRPVQGVHLAPRPYYSYNTWHSRGFDNTGFARLDPLIVHDGNASLQIVVPPGDETAVWSNPITLNQTEARLIEVTAWIKTDRLNMFDVVAMDQDGQRIPGYYFFNKLPHSVGTEDWRLIRQTFAPAKPLKSMRLILEARGVNGYTLSDTGSQPQANVVGSIWFDDINAREVESAADELATRKVKTYSNPGDKAAGLPRPWGRRTDPALLDVDFGDRLIGDNVFRATLINPSRRDVEADIQVDLSPDARLRPEHRVIPARGKIDLAIPYTILKPGVPYSTIGRGVSVTFKDGESGKGKTLTTKLPVATWTTPIMVRLGKTYLPPEQSLQTVRLNLGFTSDTMKRVAAVRLDLVRRGSGEVIKSIKVPARQADLAAQREKIPSTLCDDFANLLLVDFDVASLPIQPFNQPERAWFIRATAIDSGGSPVHDGIATAESDPFCRLASRDAQQPIRKSLVKNRMLYVNDQPWVPVSANGQAIPVFAGPLASVNSTRDLHELSALSPTEMLNLSWNSAPDLELNAYRPPSAGSTNQSSIAAAAAEWSQGNRYTSIQWIGGHPSVISVEQLNATADAEGLLAKVKASPSAVSVNPGIDEVYSHFIAFRPEAIKSLEELVKYLRKTTERPVGVGYGAALHRAEFERVPFFDLYEVGTGAFAPAPLHVDLWPALGKRDAVAWMRPEVFESEPYERIRYHTFVEMMRGARGWEFTHAPGDVSLLRGLQGEVEYMKPALASNEPGPKVSTVPSIETWSRGVSGKTVVIAATTRGMSIGSWRWADQCPNLGVTWTPAETSMKSTDMNARAAGRPRVTQAPAEDQGAPATGPVNVAGIDNLPQARVWPTGTKLVQWVKLEPRAIGVAGNLPRNLVIIPKADGRFTQTAAWGAFDAAPFTASAAYATQILRVLYRNYAGLIGWDIRRTPLGFPFLPSPQSTTRMGELPSVGQWVKLEVPLEKISADKKLIDGVVFMHEGGRVLWGKTTLVAPDGAEQVVWGDNLIPPAAELKETRVNVEGLKAGTPVRVMFEDRTIIAKDGHFVDDFTGADLYQRYGGFSSHGNLPVALHVYEVPAK